MDFNCEKKKDLFSFAVRYGIKKKEWGQKGQDKTVSVFLNHDKKMLPFNFQVDYRYFFKEFRSRQEIIYDAKISKLKIITW